VQVVRQAMLELINDYESRNGALEIADEDGYMMQVKDEFSSLVDEFAPFEMPTALVRTLSAIALKQPVSQADVIKIRGAGAYDHIRELEIRELIHKQEDGRSPILTTTKKFQEYFRLSKDGQGWRQELNTSTKSGKEGEVEAARSTATADAAAIQLDVFDASPDAGGDKTKAMMGNPDTVPADAVAISDEDTQDNQDTEDDQTTKTRSKGLVAVGSVSVSSVTSVSSGEAESEADDTAAVETSESESISL
jgi:segregation and condensation protein B